MRVCGLMSRHIVFGFAIICVIILIVSSQEVASSNKMRNYRLKRSFSDYGCKGIYEKTIYARVYQVCEACYEVMREQQLHSHCSHECFSSKYFEDCLKLLKMDDQLRQFEDWIRKLKGLGV